MLIEAAEFEPLSIRTTARQAEPAQPFVATASSAGVDPEGVDWASRRCCELILELAGGELAAGVVDVGAARPRTPADRAAAVSTASHSGDRRARRVGAAILTALGTRERRADSQIVEVVPPSWRRDLTRKST